MGSTSTPTAERLTASHPRARSSARGRSVDANAATDPSVSPPDMGDWPHRDVRRFSRTAGVDGHVQEMGRGPVVLMLHGTGASTHSWRALMPLLATRLRVIAIDLPGHGFTQTPPREFLSMFGMAMAIHSLL